MLQRDGQPEALGVSRSSQAIHRRPTGIPEVQKFCDLVVRLSDGVIQCSRDYGVVAEFANPDYFRMSAGNNQAEKWRLKVGERHDIREQVSFEVVDADQRRSPSGRKTLRSHNANQKRSHQSRTGRYRDKGKLPTRIGYAPFRKNSLNQGDHGLEVLTRCILRNDAAVWRMDFNLTRQTFRDERAITLEKRDSRVVATCLDAERQKRSHHFFPGSVRLASYSP